VTNNLSRELTLFKEGLINVETLLYTVRTQVPHPSRFPFVEFFPGGVLNDFKALEFHVGGSPVARAVKV